ncbi:MAG: M12 family metallo-peptidase, partial [Leadbetterella sp.]|nr:M12 family metallo-peptidase [Leadbetterella sp.]
MGGFISDETGNYELLRIQDSYALVPVSGIKSAILCDVKDEIIQISAEQVKAIRTDDFVNCRAVEIYFEADHTLFSAFGTIDATAEYVNRLFIQVATLFENEGIEIKISRLKVWDRPDPYESGRSNSMDMLSQFAEQMEKTGFDGDLAHLLTKSGIGGRAHINVLCFPSDFAKTGVTGSLIDDILPVPLFSRDVQVLAHELGHNFGSPHTQSCFWPNGPIDNCVLPEGNCAPTGPAPQNGGTIMSYCGHINLAHGFGELPGNLMRNYVVLCLGGKSKVEHLKVEEATATQAYLSWKTPDKYQNNFEVEYKEEDTSEWIKVQTSNPQIKLSGLKPATRYQWRVKTSCAEFGESAFLTSGETGYCDPEIVYTTCYGYAHAEAVLVNHNLMNNPAFCADKGYTFHFDRRQSLAIGKAHSFEIRMSEEQNHLKATIWIDFNNNKIFEENEKIFSSTQTFLNVLQGNFEIGSGITPVSKVRMRIMISASDTPKDPCGTIYIGEVQDHYVDLVTCGETPELPDNVQLEKVTASTAYLSWDNPDHTELLVEYREKGSEFWNGYWTTKAGIQLNVAPNTLTEWRMSRSCSGYITGEFRTPKDDYCEVSYQYPFDCAAQYGVEKFMIPDLNYALNTSCS